MWPIAKTHSTYMEYLDYSKQSKKLNFPGPTQWFTIVRHPAAKFHSWYYYQLEWDRKRIQGELNLKGNTKDFYIKRRECLLDLGLLGCLKYPDSVINTPYFMTMPQYEFIRGCKNVKTFKLEKIDKLYNWLASIGCPVQPYQSTSKKNKAKNKKWQDEFDNEMLELISERYAKDFSKFGYEL